MDDTDAGGPSRRDKAQIRSRVLAMRNMLPSDKRRQYSREIVERIVAMDAFRRARVVMAYSTFGSEVDTATFIAAVHDSGKTLVLPKIDRKRNCLAIYSVGRDEGDLMAGVWGIREPDPAVCGLVAPGTLDFVLVPGVAFDPRGGRIGYGKGYYDKLLHACMAEGGRPWTAAGAFDLQMVERIPMETHDIPIHAVATESNCIRCSGSFPASHNSGG